MNSYDFARSFLKWTSTINKHTPRLQVDASCTLARGGAGKEYFLSTMCTGEQMYVDRNLIHLPANEFAMVCAPGEEYVFFKYYADESKNVAEVHRLGEAMTTHDGRGAPIREMTVDMARFAKVRELTEYSEIREAILGNRPLNARTEYLGEDGETQVTLDYPVKICNIAHGRERWQVDTGAILLPDLKAEAPLAVGRLRMGYIVFNTPNWAEVILRTGRLAGAPAPSHFGPSRRIECRNHIFCAEV